MAPPFRTFRRSFRQTLFVAFLLIAGLLAGASVQGLFTLEQAMDRSRAASDRAALLAADTRSLAERSVAMERSARQYLVLDDPALLRAYRQAVDDALRTLEEMRSNGLPAPLAARWQALLPDIDRVLGGAPATALRARGAALDTLFRAIEAVNTEVADAARRINEARGRDLQAQLEAGRTMVGRQVLGAIVLAGLLAIAFGVWLTRPLHALERAIADLGANRLDAPVRIDGPTDLRSLGQRLDWLRLRLKELDEDKARFLRYASHELKTPLAALREGVALLEDEVAGPLTDDQREVARILGHNTAALQEQIEALLRFNAAAFEARRLQRRRTDLHALLLDVIESQHLQWQARQLVVTVEGRAPPLEVDPDQLAAALGNLLSNSIRFSPPGGQIVFTLSSTPQGVSIDLQDQGTGIAPGDRTRIFEPFYRGEVQPEGVVRGTGIGLSIVREYIHAHAGRVEVLPTAPGAHFRIELPHASH